jgi:hypothetical protein
VKACYVVGKGSQPSDYENNVEIGTSRESRSQLSIDDGDDDDDFIGDQLHIHASEIFAMLLSIVIIIQNCRPSAGEISSGFGSIYIFATDTIFHFISETESGMTAFPEFLLGGASTLIIYACMRDQK